jgi:phenylpropionate dioxygenase-like ring-hydroxylating dioxygenase large terminal subunit
MSAFDSSYEGKWDRNALDYLALVDQWHVAARSEDVTADSPFSARLLGDKIVLWRSEDGRIHAWNDYCAHRGAPLSRGKVKNCRIVCPYHGWHFDGHGQCVHVPAHPDQKPPARSVVHSYRATERYGLVWVCMGEPASDVPRLPHWDDPDFRKVSAGPYDFNANALRCLDNFMDASHFPYVHDGVNGNSDSPDTTINYQVSEIGTELRTTAFAVIQPFADARGVPLAVTYNYFCLSPTVAYSDKVTGPGQHWVTWCALTPVDVDKTIFWVVMSINYGKDIPEQKILDRQAMVIGTQDREIVEAQRPYSLPLDLQDEMHVASDRLGVAYRRLIKALGETRRDRMRRDFIIASR